MPTTTKPDKIVHTSQTLETKNYDKFTLLPGNRQVDRAHVTSLKRKIEKEGNLTQHFPIIVNEDLEIIDGQHRLQALKELGYPVFYEVKKGLTTSSVISLNTGQRNWNWRNFAKYYAQLGNENYQKVLQLSEETDEKRFGVLVYYATLGALGGYAGNVRDNARNRFNGGEFVMSGDYDLILRLLSQYQELAALAHIDMREFAHAALKLMRTPEYDHEYMVDKVAAFGETLMRCYTLNDFLNALEDLQKA